MSGMTNDSGNPPRDENNNFSETAVPDNLDVNELDFNETEVKDLASKVGEIALNEREAGLFDMHGVAPTLEEDLEMLSKSLKDMNELLTNMVSWKQASAFKLAESDSPEYARNEKLLLMFLRCENFNVKAAATRLLVFFQHKLSLFGPEKLCKETIGQSDLDTEDLATVTAGCWQLLPRRDHAGRAQFIYFPHFAQWPTPEHALRMLYYLSMAMLRDEETQKKGVVLIVHCVRKSYPSGRDPVVAWKGMQLMRKILPMKLVGLHICSSPSSGMRFYYSHIAKFFDSAGIARTRFHEGTCVGSVESSSVATHKKSLKSGCCHTGTFEEIEQQLAGFGINGVNLAISYEGDLKVERHKGMLRSLKCLEAQTSSAEDYVILPTHTDVLLGRGKPIQTHPGNIRLSLIVESLLEEYNGSKKRLAKTQLAAETVDRMKGAGVRFLTKCDEGWKIALDSLARERVSSAFRTVRDRLKTQEMALLDSQLGDWDNSDRSKRMEEKR